MSRLSARLGSEIRAAVDAVSARLRLGNAETLRLLIVLGLGGSRKDAEALNDEMRRRREEVERAAGRKREPGPHERAARQRGAIRTVFVSVRVPGAWSKRAKAFGVRAAIQIGLDRLGVIL